jgi:NAD(P)-dependent dehydrogenase (short-subunit alcohol dehydrogenase family)
MSESSMGVHSMTTVQRVVITGSTRGIGFGLAKEFVRLGHHVVISGRGKPAVEQAVAALQPVTSKVIGIPCDVSRGSDLQALWEGAVSQLGGVDLWINNAGVSHPRQRAGEMREDNIRAVQETNLLGMMLATQIAAKGMQAQGGGAIYNMEGFGSNGMAIAGMALYGASKFALTYFNKALAAELAQSHVKICYLSPGIVVTDLLKRDMGSATSKDFQKTLRTYKILGDKVDTVAPWLVERMLKPQANGARVAWLTGRKAGGRFFMSLFRQRQVITDADFT